MRTRFNQCFPKNVNRYYLWTERGALLHAKSLNTDTAWQVYEELVECYFRAKETPMLQVTTAQRTPMTAEQREQKRLAVLVGELRFRQSRLADAEAKFAQQNICIAQADDGAEQYEMQLRSRWKPVRYIRAADRRTDRRPPVHHICSALPNMNRDRRKKREGD